MIPSLSFLLPNMFKNRKFYTQRSKSFKICPKVSKIEGEIPKTQEKTRNSRKKLKLWEDFTPPERPSDVIKKACLTSPICFSVENSFSISVLTFSKDGCAPGILSEVS